MSEKETAFEFEMGNALDFYQHGCDHDPASPNYRGYPQSVCDVCRGRSSEESFEAGYRAGYDAGASTQEAEVQRLREALEVYADPSNWEMGDDATPEIQDWWYGPDDAPNENGYDRAQAALDAAEMSE